MTMGGSTVSAKSVGGVALWEYHGCASSVEGHTMFVCLIAPHSQLQIRYTQFLHFTQIYSSNYRTVAWMVALCKHKASEQPQ